jgi:hypothetical protein
MATTPRPRTRHLRVAADLAKMLGEIAWFQRVSVAEIVDPLLRKVIERRFNALPPDVRARAEARIRAAGK